MIYTRFSSELQRAESCDDQERKVREGLARLGIDLSHVEVIKDEAVSGTKENRTGYERLRRMIDAGEIGVLAVDDQSRLSRGDNVMSLIKDLVFHGGRFLAIGEGIDTAKSGWEMLVGVMGLHHATSNRETGRRVRRGQEGRVLDGNGSAGDFPYGYRSEYLDADWQKKLQSRSGKPKKRIVIDDAQATVIRDVFERFTDKQWSISRIVRHLNATGAPVGQRFKKGIWRRDHVRRMLANSKYIGRWMWGKTQTVRDSRGRTKQTPVEAANVVTAQRPELAIVDAALWERVQLRLAELRHRFGFVPGQQRRGPKRQPQLHVTEGSVEWTPAGLTSGGEPVLIVAGQSAELVDGQPVVSQIVRLLGVDFQHTASASVGVTQAGFEAFDETDGGSATYSTAGGDVTVTMTGLDGALGGHYNRGGVTHDDELTFADLYNDFAFNNGPSDSDGNGSASMTLKLTGPGIAPNTAYELTFYSYDDDDTQGDHSVVYTDISGTSGVTEPLTWAGGVDPTSDNTYAVTATFTSDDSGILTIDMTDNWTGGMPNNNGNTGIRLSAFEITRRTPEVAEPDAAGPETDPEPVVAQNDLTKPLPTESETADR